MVGVRFGFLNNLSINFDQEHILSYCIGLSCYDEEQFSLSSGTYTGQDYGVLIGYDEEIYRYFIEYTPSASLSSSDAIEHSYDVQSIGINYNFLAPLTRDSSIGFGPFLNWLIIEPSEEVVLYSGLLDNNRIVTKHSINGIQLGLEALYIYRGGFFSDNLFIEGNVRVGILNPSIEVTEEYPNSQIAAGGVETVTDTHTIAQHVKVSILLTYVIE